MKDNSVKISDADITEAILLNEGIHYERYGDIVYASIHEYSDKVIPVTAPVNYCSDWDLTFDLIKEYNIIIAYADGLAITRVDGCDFKTSYSDKNPLKSAACSYLLYRIGLKGKL